jgi:hypothetical protein
MPALRTIKAHPGARPQDRRGFSWWMSLSGLGDAEFVEIQHSRPVLLLVVRCGHLGSRDREARWRARAAVPGTPAPGTRGRADRMPVGSGSSGR